MLSVAGFPEDPCFAVEKQIDFDADLRRRHASREAGLACAVVGVLVVGMYLSVSAPARRHCRGRLAAGMRDAAMGMRTIGGAAAGASARSTVEAPPAAVLAMQVYPECAGQHVRLIETLNGAKPDAPACEMALRAFLGENRRAIVMVFAPWCPHCHGLMRELGAVGNRATVMVNGDCLSKETMGGTSDMLKGVSIQHYPFLLVQTTTNGTPSLEEAKNLLEAVAMYDGAPERRPTTSAKHTRTVNQRRALPACERDGLRGRDISEDAHHGRSVSQEEPLAFLDGLF